MLSRCSKKLFARLPRGRSFSRSSTAVLRSRHASGRVLSGRSSTRVQPELAEDVDDDVLRIGALQQKAKLGGIAGDAEAPQHAARAYELAATVGDEQLLREATNFTVADTFTNCLRLDEARALLEREYESGTSVTSCERQVLWRLSGSSSGRAVDSSRPTTPSAPTTSPSSTDSWCRRTISRSHSSLLHRGQLELARKHSQRALSSRRINRPPPTHAYGGPRARRALERDATAAADWLGKADQQAAELGWGEPSKRWWSDDYVEALLELGRIDDAVRVSTSGRRMRCGSTASGCSRT